MTRLTEPQRVIYALSCICHPLDGVRYVGLTRLGATRRLKGHLAVLKYNQVHGKPMVYSQNWMLRHGAENIISSVLEVCANDADLNAAEIRWMASLSLKGARLTNVGEGGGAATKGQKRPAQSARMAGKNNPMWGKDQSLVLAFARSHQGPVTPEIRANMAAAQLGKRHSDETRAKMSASAKTGSLSPARLDLVRRRREGLELAPAAKVTATDVVAIRLERATSGATYRSIGKPYGIGPEAVSMICRRTAWKHVA